MFNTSEGQPETRIAVYALTPQGAQLGKVLAGELGGKLFVSKRLEAETEAAGVFDSLLPFVAANWKKFDGHVFVAAAGIVVRAVAPVLEGKDKDPAVVAVDQRGRFAVSLVSGHLGGANALATMVAKVTAGQAVITTATDTEELPSLDTLAKERGLAIANLEAVKLVNIALLAGEAVQVHDPEGWLGLNPRQGIPHPWAEHFRQVASAAGWLKNYPGVWVSRERIEPQENMLVLHPPSLAVGVGCRRGVPASDIRQAVEKTLEENGLVMESVVAFASIGAKRDEAGLMEMAMELGRGLYFYDQSDLMDIEVKNPSERVQQEMGVPGVAEACAMRLADTDKLLVEKTKCTNVTVAVAVVR